MHKKPTPGIQTKPNLPLSAMSAWETYHAMSHSKRNHLDFLVYLEEKYKHYGQPNSMETHHLDSLLKIHHQQVNLFRTTLQQLKQTDHNAHQQFIVYLTKLDLPESKR
jgi:hypothetical protein